jgi:hypothetical protein
MFFVPGIVGGLSALGAAEVTNARQILETTGAVSVAAHPGILAT